MGGAGHVVPAPKGSGTMGVVMPIYTIGIVVFFMYTVMKVNRCGTAPVPPELQQELHWFPYFIV
jgi:hypothetical protein